MSIPDVASATLLRGNRVRLKDNPSREGTLSSHPAMGEGRRRKLVVVFSGGPEAILALQLEKEVLDPYLLMSHGSYGAAKHLRGAVMLCRLSGKPASLNATNTQFLHRFKPISANLK